MTDSTKPRKILVLSYWFPPYCLPGACLRIVKFVKHLAALRPNWSIELLNASYGTSEATMSPETDFLLADIPPSVRRVKIGDPGLGHAGQSKSHTTAMLMKKEPTGLSGLLRKLFGKSQKKAFAIEPMPDAQISWGQSVKRNYIGRVKEKYDLVFVTVPPFSSAVIGVELKYILGNPPLIVDMRDDWSYHWKMYPDKRYDVEHAMEAQVVSTAAAVLLPSEPSVEAYKQRYPNSDHFHFIPNGVDLDEYEGIDPSAVKLEKFKVSCSGNLDELRSPVNFLKAFKQFLADPEIDASLCELHCPMSMIEDYWKAVGELELGEKTFRTPILPPKDYQAHLLSSALLVSINYFDGTTLIPVNIYEYWAVGRPILLLEHPGAAGAIVRKNRLGAVADPDDVDWMVSELKKSYQKWRTGAQPVIDREPLKAFSRRVQTEKIIEIMEKQLQMHDIFS